MIKLLWNTHNLNIPDPNNKSYKDTLDYNWGIYHKKNSDKWIFNILEKIEFKSIEKKRKFRKQRHSYNCRFRHRKKRKFIQTIETYLIKNVSNTFRI